MKLIVEFFLLAFTVSLQQSVSATDTCSVASDGTVTTLTGALKNVELSSKAFRIFEVIDKKNPNCDLLVKARTRANSKGEISRVSVSFVGDGLPMTVYQFDLKTQKLIMPQGEFIGLAELENFPHTWNETGITVTETEGGWILSHSECGYVITVAEMEGRVLDITIPGRDQLPYAVGPCALSDDCDVEFINLPSSNGTGFEIDPTAFKLIGVCDGRNMYKGLDNDPINNREVSFLYPLWLGRNLQYLFWMVGGNPCVNWGSMLCYTRNVQTPDKCLDWLLAIDDIWVVYPDVLPLCTTSV